MPINGTIFAPNTNGAGVATFQQRGDSWRAIVRRGGVSKSETFRKKSEARAWAIKIEAEIEAGTHGTTPDKTFGEVLVRYREEVSPSKQGARWEWRLLSDTAFYIDDETG